jgi:hypothetical protein
VPYRLLFSWSSDRPLRKITPQTHRCAGHGNRTRAAPQATGNQMLLQKENGRSYLYVQQASKQGFMVVDVTKPEQPNLLKRTAESNHATAGNLAMVSPDVAIAEAPERKPTTLTSSNRPTETVRVLDLSDPRNPKTLQEFKAVTSLLPDGNHGLIFLTNNEGLWVLRYRRPALLEPAKKKPPCDSNAEIMSMPSIATSVCTTAPSPPRLC